MLGTLQKAGQVLELYSPQRPEWGVTEVARELSLPPSSVHLLLASLAQMGLLHRTGTGRYRLGFRLLGLTQILLTNTPWRVTAHQWLLDFHGRSRRRLRLAVLDGGQLLYVDAVGPGALPPAEVPPANAAPMACAAGRVILAHRPWSTVRLFLSPEARPLLAQVRSAGYAVSPDLRAPNPSESVWTAAPVLNGSGDVIAALEVEAGTNLAGDTATAALTIQAAAELSRTIGYAPEFVQDRRAELRRQPQPKR